MKTSQDTSFRNYRAQGPSGLANIRAGGETGRNPAAGMVPGLRGMKRETRPAGQMENPDRQAFP